MYALHMPNDVLHSSNNNVLIYASTFLENYMFIII